MNLKKMNKGLDFLREKYGAAKGEITVKTVIASLVRLRSSRGAWSARSSN